jgi:AbrB family looped-hinge helix DNA binding protein
MQDTISTTVYRKKISSKGQFTIPREILKKLNIEPGNYISISLSKDESQLTIQNDLSLVASLKGSLGNNIPKHLLGKTSEQLEEIYETSKAKYYQKKYAKNQVS